DDEVTLLRRDGAKRVQNHEIASRQQSGRHQPQSTSRLEESHTAGPHLRRLGAGILKCSGVVRALDVLSYRVERPAMTRCSLSTRVETMSTDHHTPIEIPGEAFERD